MAAWFVYRVTNRDVRRTTMKRIIIIGAFFTLIYFGLGMTQHVSSSTYGIECSSQCIAMLLQQDSPLPERNSGNHPQMIDRARPDRKMRGDKPPVDGRGPGADRPMTQNMIEHVMAVAKEVDPELAEQLSSICEKDPDAFEKIVRRQGRRMGSFIRLRDSDPELFEVKVAELKTDAEIFHLADELRGKDVNDSSIQGHLANLRGLVRAKMGLSIRVQSLYIERLEHHLEGLRGRLEDTTIRFDEIVEERVNHLLSGDYKEKPKESNDSTQLVD